MSNVDKFGGETGFASTSIIINRNFHEEAGEYAWNCCTQLQGLSHPAFHTRISEARCKYRITRIIEPLDPKPPALVTTLRPAALPETTLQAAMPGSISASTLSSVALMWVKNAEAISPPVTRTALTSPFKIMGETAAANPLAIGSCGVESGVPSNAFLKSDGYSAEQTRAER